jgi:hypothetical protein
VERIRAAVPRISALRLIDPTFRLEDSTGPGTLGLPRRADRRSPQTAQAEHYNGDLGRETGIIAIRALRDSASKALSVSAR